MPRSTKRVRAAIALGDLVASALGDDRRRELRAAGAAMSMDEAVSFALEHIDPKYSANPLIHWAGEQ